MHFVSRPLLWSREIPCLPCPHPLAKLASVIASFAVNPYATKDRVTRPMREHDKERDVANQSRPLFCFLLIYDIFMETLP